ncbi:cytochrome P450 [Mycena sp. CBHHK59/15]|nr:cytochrome P450 [Mycena sp. CBHHK59/15]
MWSKLDRNSHPSDMDYRTSLALLAVCIITIVGSALLSRWRANLSGLPFPPGPKQRLITGNLHDIPTKEPWLTYTDWGRRYGDIVHARVFGQHVILVNSLEAASDLFDKRAHIYSDRPVTPMIDLMGWAFNVGLMPYTNEWRRRRRLFQKCFRRDVSLSYRSIQMKKIHDLLRGLLSNPQDFVELYKTVAAAIIMSTVYGYDVEPMNDHFVTLSERAVKKLGESVFPGAAAVNAFPILRHLPGWLPGCGFQRFAADCRQLTEEMQEVPFQYAKQNMDRTGAKSIVAKLIQTNHARGGTEEQEQAIKATVSSLGSFFFAMTMHPDIQRKAQSEIDTVIGPHRLPEFEDRPSLPYVEALYREVMRWKPVLPLGVSHATSEDDIYNGCFIPKGAAVISNIWYQWCRNYCISFNLQHRAMTHDESIYPEPDRFNPDRFFTADGNLNDDNVILAFGFGRRICVGRHTAEATVWATIVSVLSVFNIAKAKDAAGTEIDVNPVYSDGIISHPQPFQCSITPRSEAAMKLVQETANNGAL